MPGRLEWTRRREIARIAHFVAPRVEADRAVAGGELAVQLRVLVAQDDVVERTAADDSAGTLVQRGLIRDLVLGVGHPEPGVVTPDRAAHFAAEVAHEIDG